MKKAQVLRIYMDNCVTDDTVDQLATGVSVDIMLCPVNLADNTMVNRRRKQLGFLGETASPAYTSRDNIRCQDGDDRTT